MSEVQTEPGVRQVLADTSIYNSATKGLVDRSVGFPKHILPSPSSFIVSQSNEGDSIPTNEEKDRGADQSMKAFCVIA
uniref:Putative peptide pheromone n=1 Tax=Coprinellus disseminatus TaxID=71703 RepID=Q1WMU2_COPDI|nr:putative peptide pheromone [Coprinellus disseminatus]